MIKRTCFVGVETFELPGILNQREKTCFEWLLAWFENWRFSRGLEADRESARIFWKAQVKVKPRQNWQLNQWAEAIRWYLGWLRHCQEHGQSGLSLEERVRRAVNQAGARRGLRRRTRQAYAGWVGRYARYLGDARATMDPANARDWLARLVTVERVSYSTQKQALCALAFFFKDICGLKRSLKKTLATTSRRIYG